MSKLGFDTAPQPEAKGFTINPNVGNVDLSAMSKPEYLSKSESAELLESIISAKDADAEAWCKDTCEDLQGSPVDDFRVVRTDAEWEEVFRRNRGAFEAMAAKAREEFKARQALKGSAVPAEIKSTLSALVDEDEDEIQ